MRLEYISVRILMPEMALDRYVILIFYNFLRIIFTFNILVIIPKGYIINLYSLYFDIKPYFLLAEQEFKLRTGKYLTVKISNHRFIASVKLLSNYYQIIYLSYLKSDVVVRRLNCWSYEQY